MVSRSNDQLLPPDQYAEFPRLTKGFRLLPLQQLPCAVLFQRTVAPAVPGRMLPSGLDFFATGPLASAAGRQALTSAEPERRFVDAVVRAECPPLPNSLHGKALDCIKLLQKPVAPSAPDPFKTQAWHDKQLSTQLAAWSEQRHTWVLHAKMNVHFLGMADNAELGYVSPYPEFFDEMGKLARATSAALREFTESEPANPKYLAARLLKLIEAAKRYNSADKDKGRDPNWPRFFAPNEVMRLQVFLEAYSGKPEEAMDQGALERLEQAARQWAR